MAEDMAGMVERAVASGVAFYGMEPSAFGDPANRGSMFRRCLVAFVSRYPYLTLEIVGTAERLRDLGLAANAPLHIGDTTIPVWSGDKQGEVQLILRPRPFKARSAQRACAAA